MATENINKILIKGYISENNYCEDMKKIVEPYLRSIEKTGRFIGVDNLEIFYKSYIVPNGKENIVISHGYSEYIEKYDELIYGYINQGYSVFMMEHRGHGRSGNLGVIDKSQVTVTNFNDYVLDFKSFMDKVVVPNSRGKNIFLFAHSMGCAIGSKFMEENKGYFKAAVLSSPMFRINTGTTPYFLAKMISNIATVFGFGDKYLLGQGKYTSECDMKWAGTTSKARYDYNYYRIEDNEIVQRGGISFRWLKECVKATKDILKKENIEKINIPILIFQATNDVYVKIEAQNEFYKYAKKCTLKVVEGARHDIYTEIDTIRKPYLQQIFKFYDEN